MAYASATQLSTFTNFPRPLLQAEVAASRTLEKILYESRRKGRDHYTLLHRHLTVK